MKNIILGIVVFFPFLTLSLAQITNVNFSGGGITSYSAWSDLTFFDYPGYGSFPGNQPWPAPIVATDGSVNASLNRISGAPGGGGPYPASEAIYFGSFTQIPNALGGTLRILDNAPLFNLRTIVFQIQIGEATGFDFHQPTGFPKLSFNNGIEANATYTNLVNRFQNGTFPSPQTGLDEPVYVNTWAYQWNFGPSNGFETLYIDFSGVTHSQVYALRLDGTTVLQSTPVIPEPSTLALLVLAASGLAAYNIRKRNRF